MTEGRGGGEEKKPVPELTHGNQERADMAQAYTPSTPFYTPPTASSSGYIGPDLNHIADDPNSIFGQIGGLFGALGKKPLKDFPLPVIGQLGSLFPDAEVGDLGALLAPPSTEQFNNPLYALGPEGGFAGNIGEAAGPIARSISNKVVGGVESALRPATSAAAAGPESNLERMIANGGDFTRIPKGDAGTLLKDAESDFLTQRRGVRSHEETQAAAEQILRAGLTSDDVVRLGQSGTAVNAENLLAANKVADSAAENFVKAVNAGDDPLAALVETLKVQKAVRGFIAEGGRVTEANKLIKTEIADRAATDGDTARQLIQAARGLENPNNLKTITTLAKDLNFSDKDEVRRFLSVVLDMGEAEAKARVTPPTMAENIISAANLPKTIMASYDLSAPFRQGAVLSAAHPGVAARSTKVMLEALKDANFAKQAMREIQTGPMAPIRKKSGLYLSEWENTPLKAREEAFMSNLAEKIPGVSASNRAYAMYLNKLRADVFDQTVAAWGGPLAKKESEYKALAQFINWSTGRGDLGAFNSSAPLLNAMFFSPRLVVSRLQTAVAPAVFLAQGNTAAAKMAAGDLVKFVGAGMAVLTLAQLGGANVESDPRSSKFGKIEVGPHQIDIWAGFQPVARYAAQFITGERKTQSGDIVVTDGSGPFGETRIDTAGRFLRSKLSPPVSAAVDALSGTDFVGNKVDPASAIASRTIPLGWQQMYEAVEADRKDAIRGGIVGALGLVGLGTVSIDDGTNEPLVQNPFNPRSPLDIEAARLKAEAPAVEGLTLNADQQRSLTHYVEDARHSALTNLLNDPAYTSADAATKRDIWERTSNQAATSGRKAFGIDLASNGKNQEEIVAGTLTALKATTGNYGRGEVIDLLTQDGALTDEIVQMIDGRRQQTDRSKPDYELSVGEYTHGKELVDAYRKAPAFTIGDPIVWSVAKRARDQLVELRRGKTADEIKNSRQIQDFYTTAANGWLKTLYSSDGSRNEKYIGTARAAISKDRIWDRFRDAVSDEP